MTKEGASDHFRKLGALMLAVEATESGGRPLDLDLGMSTAVELILELKTNSQKIMSVGNGGSAAIVSHVQMDFCNAVGLQAHVFNETALLTALSNDYGYESAFERLVKLWGSEGDLLLAISSSGQSENILRAARAARDAGCRVITFSGFDPDNPLRGMGDLGFYVPSSSYGFVEICHGALAHYLTDKAAESLKHGS